MLQLPWKTVGGFSKNETEPPYDSAIPLLVYTRNDWKVVTPTGNRYLYTRFTGNCIQYPVINIMEKSMTKNMCVCVCVCVYKTESLHCTAEINTAL